ncbi:hypothetical protein [Gemmatimonas sp.]|jgi:hypothetical protein|uniref:hypothetical protein n=1 Tax=Gemmatimonas sp. TaxID=1962908 RepID=UPI0022C7D938|nr:hypothetical protein [Gemmatimonas sp.]MCA2983630.1 hypothetical protein [Gemmatimonas sp.]MCZ8012230.1 hypothetical protein [Gemmatimonas sp.]MCZ8266840.1 hypothetical protein [Gemmatimonas sp.]
MNPLALLPYALAAAGGHVGAHSANALTAAGFTLLQRSARLVRLLAGKQAAALLEQPQQWVVAFAASDGRALVGLDPALSVDALAGLCATHNVGAVFTTAALAPRLPPHVPRVLLDQVPRAAQLHVETQVATVDLGSHFALELVGVQEGEESAGSTETCYLEAATGKRRSHGELLQQASATGSARQGTQVAPVARGAALHEPSVLVAALLAPLLAGATIPLEHAGDVVT